MYKTSIITDEVSQDLSVVARLANEYGLDALEIRSVNNKNPFQMEKDDVRDIKRISDEHNLKICAIGSPLFKCHIDDKTDYEYHLEGLKRCIDAAHLWQTNQIRSFTFWVEDDRKITLEEIAEKMHPAIKMAESENINLLIESEPSVNTKNTQVLFDFLKMVNSKNLGAMWDPGNEIADRNAPPPFPNGYEIIKPYIKHIHLKDIKRNYDDNKFIIPALIGEGDVDFEGLLKRLKQDNYSGYVSVETHYRVTNSVNDDLLMQPQGEEFSKGGYEASVMYLDRLRDRYNWMDNKAMI